VPYSIVRQPTDRNSGVLFFPIDISLSSCACSGGEAGLVSRPEDWSRPAGSSYNEYAGMSANEQKERWGLIVDRVIMPPDARARI
jgi:hypothetical protein